jgi:hypothetical protein
VVKKQFQDEKHLAENMEMDKAIGRCFFCVEYNFHYFVSVYTGSGYAFDVDSLCGTSSGWQSTKTKERLDSHERNVAEFGTGSYFI